MKKTILICFILIGIGYIAGRKYLEAFSLNQKNVKNYYFLREGIYENKNIFEETQTNLRKKIMEYSNDKIYIYVAITRNIEVAEAIQKIYKKNGTDLQIEERKIENEELSISVEQFDLLIDKITTEEELLKIEEVVLASYEEIMKNREET